MNMSVAPRGFISSFWWLPILSGFIWLGMLLGMLLYWVVGTNSRRYDAIPDGQSLAYISHIGAYEMHPLFIAGCVLTAFTLDASFLAERWLRHRGRLVPNTRNEKILVGLSIFFALVGTVGLICLSVFDTVNHEDSHAVFLLLFIGGYLISAIFICWEYQRLGAKNRAHSVLRNSFWIKLAFVLVEAGLAIAFITNERLKNRNAAAYLEWIISFIFTAYVWSFAVDLWPAIRTKSYTQRFSKAMMTPREMEETGDSVGSLPTEPAPTAQGYPVAHS